MVFLAGLLMPNRKITNDEFACSEFKQVELLAPDIDLEAGFPRFGYQPVVKELGGGSWTVDAEIVHFRRDGELETLAIPPGVITVELPSKFELGDLVSVSGPHGRHIQVDLPIHAQPGGKLRLQLAPQAELRIQLPLEKRSRAQVIIRKTDGAEILVKVPKGVHPGGSFQAAPPVLMVAVPEDAQPGDFVVFRHHEGGLGGSIRTEYCRAQVPVELQFGRYFAARLPTKNTIGILASNKKSWSALRTQISTKPTRPWVGTLA